MIRARFAPSPTGLLHVGNARTAVFTWFFARRSGGAFIVRIEDTDQERSERTYEDAIYADLRWLGLNWEEAPDIGGAFGPYRQSERFHLYREYAIRLVGSGHAFNCFCTEADLATHAEKAKESGQTIKYPGTCRNLDPAVVSGRLAAGEPAVVRLKVRDGAVRFDDIVHGAMEFQCDVISDPILLRSDGSPTYNYAVVIDDFLMKITHVIRGDDHLSNTPKQVLIYEALGAPMPEFAHLSTILGPDHTRLSKRHGATSISQFREAGFLPEALLNYIALLGWSPVSEGSEVLETAELVSQFRLDRVNKSPAVFDVAKLRFINRSHLRKRGDLESLVAGQLRSAGWMPATGGDAWVARVTELVVPGVDLLTEVPAALESMLAFPVEQSAGIEDVTGDEGSLDLLRRLGAELSAADGLTVDAFRAVSARLKEATGRKGKALFHPLRVALTARASGPELDKLIPLIEEGARALPEKVESCRVRVARFVERYG